MEPYHFIDRFYYLEHFVVADLAVTVDVVELEGPVKLVLHLAAARDAQCADELLEVDGPRFVGVEYIEDIIGE